MKIDDYPRSTLKKNLRVTALQIAAIINSKLCTIKKCDRKELRFHYCQERGDVGTAPLVHIIRDTVSRSAFWIFVTRDHFRSDLRSHRADKDMAERCLQSNKGFSIQYSCHAGDKRNACSGDACSYPKAWELLKMAAHTQLGYKSLLGVRACLFTEENKW